MEGMAKYVPNRAPVLAVLLETSNLKNAAGWCSGEVIDNPSPKDDSDLYLGIFVKAQGGGLTVAHPGDYLIKDNQGRFAVLPPETFNKRYSKLRTRQFEKKELVS